MARSSTLTNPPTIKVDFFFFLTTEVVFSHFQIWVIVSSDKAIYLGEHLVLARTPLFSVWPVYSKHNPDNPR